MRTLISLSLGLFLIFLGPQAQALELNGIADGLTVKLSLPGNPVRPGMKHARIVVLDEHGKPMTNAKVTLYYGMMAMAGMPPMNFKTRLDADGEAYTSQLDLKMKGHWNFKVKVRSVDGKSRTAKMGVMVR
ncbi:MAG: FixH family protein [Acidiferrobacterales bacterium]